MCRMLAYLGPPATLESLLLAPEHSLLEQSYAPRHQTSGVVNADGFGVGWYDRDRRPEPARYRTSTSMWADRSFASLAGLVASGAALAAVRSATPPLPVEDSGVPPFTAGPWLFAHNGAVRGFRDGLGVRLRRSLSERRDAGIEGSCDSEVLFAQVLDRLDWGATPGEALAEVVSLVDRLGRERSGPGSGLNFLLTDGTQIAATTWGHSLFTLCDETAGSVVVASEPFDTRPTWRKVADRTLVEATTAGVRLRPLA
jgi:glutamine amidotransferase